MEVYFTKNDFSDTKVIDHFKSLIWTDRYWEAGDFEMYVEAESNLLDQFEKGMFVMIQDSDRVMVIESLEVTTDVEEGNFLKISGHSVEYLLARRIVWKKRKCNDLLQTCISNLLKENALNPIDTDRKLSVFNTEMIDSTNALYHILDTEYDGDNLYDILCDLCEQYKMGFRAILDDSGTKFNFEIYLGNYRGWEQTEFSYVIFSPRYDNLISTEFLDSVEDYYNVTLVGGDENDDDERFYVTVGSGTDMDRFEIFTDGSSRPQSDDMIWIYEVYKSGIYTYTTSFSTADSYVDLGWTNNGKVVAVYTYYTSDATAVHQLSNASEDDNGNRTSYDVVFTTNSSEYESLRASDTWSDDGIVFYSTGTVPVYRFYKSGVGHAYSINTSISGYTREGIAFYGVYTPDDYDISDPESNTVYVSDDIYTDLLETDGNKTLTDHKQITSFDAEVDNFQFIYNQDYFIGDTVDIESPYGTLLGLARITEGVVSYDTDGYRVYANFEMVDDTEEEADENWVVRLYNPNTSVHYYTPDKTEYNDLKKKGWTYEGQHWEAPTEGYRVYKLYHEVITEVEEKWTDSNGNEQTTTVSKITTRDYIWTLDNDEYQELKKTRNWEDQGVVFYSDGDIPVYRMYNSSLDKHLFTVDESEYDSLSYKGWTQEGVKLYGISK